MTKITKIAAREIVDSRGNPTVEVDVFTDNHMGRAAVPSGASTGAHEAVELRDKDAGRFNGKGVTQAVTNVIETIQPELIGMDASQQQALDKKLIELDGTPNKSKLGANAILGVSMAASKAAAAEKGIPLFQHFGELAGNSNFMLPTPMMNIVNGGEHSDAGLSIQEFMIVPRAENIREAVRMGAETFHALKKILEDKGLTTSVGDEGGFAPKIESHREVLETIMHAIDTAGHSGKIDIALDCAASEFFGSGKYSIEGNILSSEELVEFYADLFKDFPIVSVEDSHAEDDFDGFKAMKQKFGSDIQLVGDDLFVTNVQRIQLGIDQDLANAVLIKLNQIGSITETIEAIELSKKAGWNNVVSHRSGETEDTTIADFVVGLGTGQIKTGSLSRTDRVCKYNQLIRIAEQLAA